MGPIDPKYANAVAVSKMLGIRPKERKVLRRIARGHNHVDNAATKALEAKGYIVFMAETVMITEYGVAVLKALAPHG